MMVYFLKRKIFRSLRKSRNFRNFGRFKFAYIGKRKRIRNVFLRIRRFDFKTLKSRILYSKRFLFAGIFSRRRVLAFKGGKWVRPRARKYARKFLHPRFFYFLYPSFSPYHSEDNRLVNAQEFLPFYYLIFDTYSQDTSQIESIKYVSLRKYIVRKSRVRARARALRFRKRLRRSDRGRLRQGKPILRSFLSVNARKETIFKWGPALSRLLELPHRRTPYLYGKQPLVFKPFFYGPVEPYYLGRMRSPENEVLKFNIRIREEQRKYAKFMLLSRRQLCKVVRKAYLYYGRSLYNFAIVLEYRLDNVLCHLNYASNNLAARHWIKAGGVQVESTTNFSRGIARVLKTPEYVGQFDLIRVHPRTVSALNGLVNIRNFKFNVLYLLILFGLANDLFSANRLVESGSVFVNGNEPVLSEMSFPIHNKFEVRKYFTYYFEKWLLDTYSNRLQYLRRLFSSFGQKVMFKNEYFLLNNNLYAFKAVFPSVNLFLVLAGNVTFYQLKRYMYSKRRLKFLYYAGKLLSEKRTNLVFGKTALFNDKLQSPVVLQLSKLKMGFRPTGLIVGDNQGFVLGLSWLKSAKVSKKHLQHSKLLSAGRLSKRFWQVPPYLEMNYSIESALFYRVPYVSELRTANIFILYFIYYYFRKYT